MQINANGISIHYQIDGPENAPWLTMSHSLAANLDMWEWQMPALTEHFRVLRYDTRGHGQTDAPDNDYSLKLLTDDLFGLLYALGIEKTHYVGLSMGGMIGQTAALYTQEKFLSLSLCDTSSHIPPSAHSTWLKRIDLARAQGMSALVDGTIDRWFSSTYQQNFPVEVNKIREMILATPVAGFCGCAHAIMGLNVTQDISAITLPTLVLVGEDDPGTPVSAHEVIHNRIGGSQFDILPNALHFSNVEQDDAFNQALLSFLTEHTN